MGIVLGKPLNFNYNDYHIVPPTDCDIPINRSCTAPFARSEYDPPNLFTLRLLEYHIHKYLPQVRELETEGPYPRDPAKVERLHQMAQDYIAALPPPFRLDNPDTSFDAECPMLPSQRESLHSTAWLFVLTLHRPYIFSLSKSRTEIMKAGIQILNAQQRFFITLEPHHHRMFFLNYVTVEPCVSMLAVLIAFPHENADLVLEAFRCLRESLQRLNMIRGANKGAGQGADVIKDLLIRAEKNRPSTSPVFKSSISSEVMSSEKVTTPSNLSAQEPTFFATSTSFEDMPDWNSQVQPISGVMAPISPGYQFDASLFRPVADLTYNELAVAMSEEELSAGSGSDGVSADVAHQFCGEFGEGSFWNFVNRGNGQWNGA